jgi:hypothetical protein
MPPHHLGLWDAVSLSSLTNIYPLNLENLMVEPAAADNRKNAYRGVIKKDLQDKFGLLGLAYYLAIRPVLIQTLNRLGSYLPGHTILASYVKY